MLSSSFSVHSQHSKQRECGSIGTFSAASFLSRWLLPDTSSPLSHQDWQEKLDEIATCLRGNDEEVIPLWQLREFGLSRGGFLCADMRKRAWPKLLQCQPENASTNECLDPENLQLLQHTVGQTIWNMEEHLLASREERRLEQEYIDQNLAQLRKRVSFKEPLERAKSPPPKNNKPPLTIATTNDDETSLLSHDLEDEVSQMNGSASAEDDMTTTTMDTSFSLSSRVVRWRKATPQEQKILYNVISSVMQTRPESHEAFVDDRYFHYAGLQDLCALLVINLESPSLTSLVLAKLAKYHLRDAMRPDKTILDTALDTVMPLLEFVDPNLCSHLYECGITLPTFCRSWIACWFAQDVPYAPMASRLLDAFLVGHASMVVYTVVAFLTTNREYIFGAQTDYSNLSLLYTTVRGLPLHSLTQGLDFNDEDDIAVGMERIETVLSRAMEYMKRLPPNDLMEMARNSMLDPSPTNAVVMFDPPPSFLTAGSAPTDYAYLKSARAQRKQGQNDSSKTPTPRSFNQSPRNRYSVPCEDEEEEEVNDDSVPQLTEAVSLDNDEESPRRSSAKVREADPLETYPMVAAALGMYQSSMRPRSTSRLYLFFFILFGILMAIGVGSFEGGIPMSTQLARLPTSRSQAKKPFVLLLPSSGSSSNASELPKVNHQALAVFHENMFRAVLEPFRFLKGVWRVVQCLWRRK